MTDKYRVRNWKEFQHYKDRNPPWIKLHFALLASEDWVMLKDASRLLAIVCMLIASRNEGHVPNNPAYLKRVGYLDHEPDLAPLISCGFLEIPLADASVMQAHASKPEQTQADARPETEQIQNRGEKKDTNSSQPEDTRDDLDKLEAALRKAAGAQNNPSPKLFDLSPILRLIDSGVSLDRVILPKLRGLSAAGKSFRSWQYPAQIITDELAQQGKQLAPKAEDDEAWKSRLGHGRNRKIWATSQWGPPPNHPGCRVPAHLITPGDGDGWQDWKPEAA